MAAWKQRPHHIGGVNRGGIGGSGAASRISAASHRGAASRRLSGLGSIGAHRSSSRISACGIIAASQHRHLTHRGAQRGVAKRKHHRHRGIGSAASARRRRKSSAALSVAAHRRLALKLGARLGGLLGVGARRNVGASARRSSRSWRLARRRAGGGIGGANLGALGGARRWRKSALIGMSAHRSALNMAASRRRSASRGIAQRSWRRRRGIETRRRSAAAHHRQQRRRGVAAARRRKTGGISSLAASAYRRIGVSASA